LLPGAGNRFKELGLELGEERYIYSAEKDDVELERLGLQASAIDPVTIRHLMTIGVTEGWKCLEVGAGTGTIGQWLSRRVGSTGSVVATDIDLRFLERLRAPNLEVRRHDILNDDLEQDAYDLVHCRKLLEHLSDPEKALRRMADAVRRGGWLLVEEDDYGSVLSVDVTDPSRAAFAATCRAAYDFVRKRGIVDMYLGRRLRGLVENLGFIDVSQEGWTRIARARKKGDED
jgi:SAM-dependent methyltransferase